MVNQEGLQEIANEVSNKILFQKKGFKEAMREILADKRIYSDQERLEYFQKIGSILGSRRRRKKSK